MLYKIQDVNYDIIHVQHEPVTNMILQLYPNIEKIATIHSEVIDLEKPVKHESIKRYIAIRPEIKEHIIEQDEIDMSLIDVIYNPIDETRFNQIETTEENAVLFVGTIDYLREQTIKDLIEYTDENKMELWIVGENKSDYLDDILLNNHVKRFSPTWNTETFVRKAKETAGILLGRTTIESWMCGKKSWIYNVDKSGGILSKELVSPPQDINKFYGSTVCEKLVDSYLNIINETSN
jgi:glycosyltransferase involved in cell wall biosynthesis